MSNAEVYEAITDRMIAALKQGTVPWHKPWAGSGGRPRSMSTGNAYTGINPWLLQMTACERGYTSPWWGTFRQIQELGGQVRKGQNKASGCGATGVVFWKTFTPKDAKPDPETGELREVAVARLYSVFNADQCEGLPERFYPAPQPDGEPELDATAEDVIGAYLAAGGPSLAHDGGSRAYYRISDDTVHLPPLASFESAGGFHGTVFHELAHSTGHPSRLDIPESGGNHFGDAKYSREELRAEMAAAMLAAETGVDTEGLFDNSAAYIASWLEELGSDTKLVSTAASQAQKAAGLVLAPSRQAEPAPEPAPATGRRADREPEAA